MLLLEQSIRGRYVYTSHKIIIWLQIKLDIVWFFGLEYICVLLKGKSCYGMLFTPVSTSDYL